MVKDLITLNCKGGDTKYKYDELSKKGGIYNESVKGWRIYKF